VDEDGCYRDYGDYQMAGVKGTGSEIKVAFVEPAGSMTGKLYPTGNPEDTIVIDAPRNGDGPFSVQATLIDVANPFAIVDALTVPSRYVQGSPEWLTMVEDIRQKAAVMMRLAPSVEQAALTRGTPKIMFVSPPNDSNPLSISPDINVLAMSMGQIHPSLQLTGAVCLASAACLKGTVAYRYQRREFPEALSGYESSDSDTEPSRTVRISHRSGEISVGVHTCGDRQVEKCIVSRTARKLFEGNVLFYV